MKDLNRIFLEDADVYCTPLDVICGCIDEHAVIANPPMKGGVL